MWEVELEQQTISWYIELFDFIIVILSLAI